MSSSVPRPYSVEVRSPHPFSRVNSSGSHVTAE